MVLVLVVSQVGYYKTLKGHKNLLWWVLPDGPYSLFQFEGVWCHFYPQNSIEHSLCSFSACLLLEVYLTANISIFWIGKVFKFVKHLLFRKRWTNFSQLSWQPNWKWSYIIANKESSFISKCFCSVSIFFSEWHVFTWWTVGNASIFNL